MVNEDPDQPMEENEQMKTNKQHMDCNNHLLGIKWRVKEKEKIVLFVGVL